MPVGEEAVVLVVVVQLVVAAAVEAAAVAPAAAKVFHARFAVGDGICVYVPDPVGYERDGGHGPNKKPRVDLRENEHVVSIMEMVRDTPKFLQF
jgi:hypothetical protein